MNNKFYVTTAIDYINGKPHIGHSYEKVAADVLARFHRAQKDDVLFVTGTDEHGAKIEEFANNAGVPTQEFSDEAAKGFKSAWDNLNLSYDRFIRTTDQDHVKVVENLVTKIKDNEFLYEADYEGLYCVGHEAFLTEKDLVDGLCPDHQSKPDLIKEKNWFFKVSSFTEEIKKQIEEDTLRIFPKHSRKEILNMLEEGFTDIAVTRPNVKWGIPVPWDKDQTIYVWVDALINYYTASKVGDKDYWPADIHIIGPDIAKFHCIIWPALLLAANLPLPKTVAVHGFLTLNEQKLSKTTGNIIDPNDWVEKFGADAVRYFLMREVPFDSHGDISEAKLRARYDGDLANGLGNLVSRIANLIEKHLDGVMPECEQKVELERKDISELMNKFEFHKVLELIWHDIAKANKLVDENKLWEIAKTDKSKFIAVTAEVLSILEETAKNLQPFMPESSSKILEIIGASKIVKPEPLFPRIN